MTSFEEIYDLFMVTSVSDYRLNNLYIDDKEAFYDFLRGFLTKSAFKFSNELIHTFTINDWDLYTELNDEFILKQESLKTAQI